MGGGKKEGRVRGRTGKREECDIPLTSHQL